MKFFKFHSLGNDFLIIDETESKGFSDISTLAGRICDRHTGVGADGLLLVSVKDKTKGRVKFRIFNADGTEAEISGNGLRCAAAYLYNQKKINSPQITFLTTAGQRECKLIEGKKNLFHIRIEMGIPHLNSKAIPFDDGSTHEKIIDYPLSINQKIYPITVISLGNPHCAIFVDRFPARIEWHQIGREIESHPFFPNRTNIEFIRVLSRDVIDVLFWERGVGETLSSGSGSCAAAVASILKNLTDRRVQVRTSMGYLTVEWEKKKVYQSGPAEVVLKGTFLSA
ncbi:MAG: diaminopimelate epimerase [Candidatus Aminicenantes bacterium]|nr:MAG: diaminopimelate epimerase [Candidatus Aminicenantes bacterium]